MALREPVNAVWCGAAGLRVKRLPRQAARAAGWSDQYWGNTVGADGVLAVEAGTGLFCGRL